jgi:hypothetical protein
MYKKILLAIILSNIFINIGFGQIDDIKKKADKNKNNENKDKDKKNSKSSGGGSCADGCFQSCADGCFNIVIATFVEALLEKHKDIMANREKYPTALSLDIMPQAGMGVYFRNPSNNTYEYALPRIHGNWGVLSTDLRLNYLTTYKNHTSDEYKTIEWNVLQINLFPDKDFKISIGSGMLYEYYTNNYYNEHYLGFEDSYRNRKFITTLEGRLSTNYKSPINFFEATFRGNYRILNFRHLAGYFSLGIIYQNYYSSIDLLMGQTGFMFTIY